MRSTDVKVPWRKQCRQNITEQLVEGCTPAWRTQEFWSLLLRPKCTLQNQHQIQTQSEVGHPK